jgi:hypothetical protein
MGLKKMFMNLKFKSTCSMSNPNMMINNFYIID